MKAVEFEAAGLPALTVNPIADSADREAWLATRGGLITASDVGALLNEHSYVDKNNRETVIATKAGQLPPFEGNRRTRWGLRMEPVIIDELREEEELDIRPVGLLIRDPGCPLLGATPDAVIAGQYTWENCQIKTHGGFPWRKQHPRYGVVPPQYWWQVQAEMACLGLTHTRLVVLHGGTFTTATYHIDYDPSAVVRIRQAVSDAWAEVERRRAKR